MGKKLYVGNLSYSISDHDLLKLFEPHGTVESAQVLGISEGLASKRYGRALRKLLAILKELFGSESEFRS